MLDMFNLRNITVDVQNEVSVVQVGATLGEVYYRIWEESNVHGFPAGVCPTVGVGGHFSGGGYGNMMRKYGLSIDHIIDAQIVDVKDYVKNPISKDGLEWIWKKMIELGQTSLVFNPYGGRMDEISANATAFPHRAGNLFKIEYSVNWDEPGVAAEKNFTTQIRRLYSYMTPFVSKNPRSAFLNYRDLDIGINNHQGNNSYQEGEVYGIKYFDNNFYRLVKIKTEIDPENYFRNVQSIPTLKLRYS
uniref:Reticuline oxidase-like protein n=1 Tax=Cajanus cajan TaxID=3821 RepID=A0A151SB26_CAJCA|nr:Reticuline oxidase-like protein [Cajanus cajan]